MSDWDKLGTPVDDWDAIGTPVQPESATGADYYAGIGRSAAQGLTFGFGDEIEAGVRTGFGLAGDYDKTLEGVRGEISNFRESNPVESTVADIGGSVATLALPLSWAGRAGQLLTGSKLGTMGGQSARALATEGAKVAATAGGARAFGSGQDGVVSRTTDTATALPALAVTGAIAAPVLDRVIGALGGTAKATTNVARNLSGDTETMARKEVARAFDADNFDVSKAVADLTPDYGKLNASAIRSVLTNYGDDLARNGGDDLAARKSAESALVASGVKPSTAQTQVREIVRRYYDKNSVPVNVSELPALGNDVSHATDLMTRAAHNRASSGAQKFREDVVNRQFRINETIDDLISGVTGGRDADELLFGLEQAAKSANSVAYKALREKNEPINITKQLNRIKREYGDRFGPIGAQVRSVVDDLFFNSRPPSNIKEFMDVKPLLDDAIGGSFRTEGVRQVPTALTAELQKIKQRLMEAVDRAVPDYAVARKAAEQGFNRQSAVKMAKDLTLRSGSKQRQALRSFQALKPEEQNLARVAFAQNLSDMLQNRKETHDVANLFATRSARATLEAVLGKGAAEKLATQLDRAGAATRTFQKLGGSQTTPLAKEMERSSFGSALKAAGAFLNPMGMVEASAGYIDDVIRQGKDTELLRIMGASTDNPADIFRVLQQLQDVQARLGPQAAGMDRSINAMVERLRLRLTPATTVAAGQQAGANSR
jgi:hypothetical protein